MRSRSATLVVLVALVAVALIWVGRTPHRSDTVRSTHSAYTFTCCSARDADRVYHPGEVVTLHWIRQTTTSDGGTKPTPITLTATLDGAFANAADAKADGARGTENVAAPPVEVTDQTLTAPVSRLRIPADATSGLYDLTTKAEIDGWSVSATGTIRIAGRRTHLSG